MTSVTYGSIRSVTYSRVGQSEAPASFTSRIPAKNSRTQRLKTFQAQEIEVGKFLGSGSFSTVYSVRIRSQQDVDFSYTSILDTHSVSTVPTDGSWGEDEDDVDDNHSAASFSVFHVKSGLGHSSRALKINATDRHKHAIKRMREDLVAKKRREAMEVLRNEVSVLSLLPSFHPNIINIHGISENFWADTSNGFFVIERLVESLDTTLKRWKAEALQGGGKNHKASRSRWSFFRRRPRNRHNSHNRSRKKQFHLSRQSQAERVNSVGVDLAKALFFLHKNWILFRDLKSENIGFDLDGNVRIFDFGLARRFKPGIHRKITMHVGTLRYVSWLTLSKTVLQCRRKNNPFCFGGLLTDLISFFHCILLRMILPIDIFVLSYRWHPK